MPIVEYCNPLASSFQSGLSSALGAGWRRMIRLCVPANSAPVLAIVANCASCHDWDGQVVWAYYYGR
jgi:cytochrome c553